MVKKTADKWRIDIFDGELGGRFAESFFREMQEQAKAVAISCDRMWLACRSRSRRLIKNDWRREEGWQKSWLYLPLDQSVSTS